jgi:hypothetical protein
MSAQPQASRRILVREAVPDDLPRILELRAMQEREFIGRVPPPPMWVVVEEDGVVEAAAGGFISTLPDYPVTVTATDILDSGTLPGKRCLVALLEDIMRAKESGVKIHTIVPSDRMPLIDALIKRGLQITGVELG